MNTQDAAVLESLLHGLAQALTSALRDAELAGEVLAALRRRSTQASQDVRGIDDLVDDGRFAVHWNGRECPLGPTLPFRFFRQLALARNRYVPVERLLENVWGGPRSASAVRSVVLELRRRLNTAGMADLARAVESKPGHYRLCTDVLSGRKNPTQIGQESDADPTAFYA